MTTGTPEQEGPGKVQDPGFRPVDLGSRAVRPVPGDHRHWHALGRPLEMLELNRLQSNLSGRNGANVHPGDLQKLGEYATKAGRVEALAYLAARGDVDDEEWEAQGERGRKGDYFKAIDQSEAILARIHGALLRKEAAAAVCSHMRSSYMAGRTAARSRSQNIAPGMRR